MTVAMFIAEAVARDRIPTRRMCHKFDLGGRVRRNLEADVVAVYMQLGCLVGGPAQRDRLINGDANDFVTDDLPIFNLNFNPLPSSIVGCRVLRRDKNWTQSKNEHSSRYRKDNFEDLSTHS